VRAERGIGDAYMRLLQRRGEFATPRRREDLEQLLSATGDAFHVATEGHMAYVNLLKEAAHVSRLSRD
jgi:hypothetical protein